MSGLSDLGDLDHLSEAERLALCEELGRLNRMVPLSPAPETTDASPPCRTPAAPGAGDSFSTQGAPA
jgi:hypothetical protein